MSKAVELLKEVINLLETEENRETCESTVGNNYKSQLSTFVPGDIIKGNETDTEYIVLEHFKKDGTTLVGAKEFMFKDVQFDPNKPVYEGSNLQRRIEEECLPIFEKDFGSDNLLAEEVYMITVDGQHPDKNIVCKVRPKTFDEARKYTELLNKDKLDYYEWTMTRWSTPDRGWEYSVAVVSPSGCIHDDNCGCNYIGVRPVCILKSSIFVSKGE